MTTTNFPELVELEGKIAERRKKLETIMTEAGPTLDMGKVKSLDGDSMSKVEQLRALDAELADLAKQAEPLKALKGIADRYIVDESGKKGVVESGDERKSDDREPMSFADAYFATKSRAEKGREFEVADFDLKTTFTTSAGWAPFSPRNDRVVDFATRPVELLDFMPTAPLGTPSFTYMEETTFTNAAVETSEGAAKPEATLALTERTATARKIAVYLPVTDEQLDDVPAAKAYLNQRLGFMVRQRLSGQIVAGDGSAPNIRGILNVSGIQTQATSTDPVPDAVFKAMTKVRVTGQAEPDAYVTHPNDWQDVRLLRTADGIYIWGNPSEAGPERIWGLQVVIAQAMTQNTGVVGAWQMYSTLFIRQGLVVETGYNADDFTKNKQTIRAEMRAVPVFWRPSAFCTVTGV